MAWAFQDILNVGIQIMLLVCMGWSFARFGLLTPDKFMGQINVLILRVAFPTMTIYLLGLKVDLRDAEAWKSLGAYVLWVSLVQLGIVAYSWLFNDRNLGYAGSLNLILTANNTVIVGLPVMSATFPEAGSRISLLTAFVLFLQVIPFSITAFEVEKWMADEPSRPRHAASSALCDRDGAPPGPGDANGPSESPYGKGGGPQGQAVEKFAGRAGGSATGGKVRQRPGVEASRDASAAGGDGTPAASGKKVALRRKVRGLWRRRGTSGVAGDAVAGAGAGSPDTDRCRADDAGAAPDATARNETPDGISIQPTFANGLAVAAAAAAAVAVGSLGEPASRLELMPASAVSVSDQETAPQADAGALTFPPGLAAPSLRFAVVERDSTPQHVAARQASWPLSPRPALEPSVACLDRKTSSGMPGLEPCPEPAADQGALAWGRGGPNGLPTCQRDGVELCRTQLPRSASTRDSDSSTSSRSSRSPAMYHSVGDARIVGVRGGSQGLDVIAAAPATVAARANPHMPMHCLPAPTSAPCGIDRTTQQPSPSPSALVRAASGAASATKVPPKAAASPSDQPKPSSTTAVVRTAATGAALHRRVFLRGRASVDRPYRQAADAASYAAGGGAAGKRRSDPGRSDPGVQRQSFPVHWPPVLDLEASVRVALRGVDGVSTVGVTAAPAASRVSRASVYGSGYESPGTSPPVSRRLLPSLAIACPDLPVPQAISLARATTGYATNTNAARTSWNGADGGPPSVAGDCSARPSVGRTSVGRPSALLLPAESAAAADAPLPLPPAPLAPHRAIWHWLCHQFMAHRRAWTITWIIVKNPLLWSLFVALLVNLSGLRQILYAPAGSHLYRPELGWVAGTLAWTSGITVPISLFSQGVWMHGKSFGGPNLWRACWMLALKVVVLGPLQLVCAAVCQLRAEAAMSILLLALCPVASTSFVIAAQYGRGADIVTTVTLLGIVLLVPILLVALALPRAFGLYDYTVAPS